jgi:GTPase SAR1 family protein
MGQALKQESAVHTQNASGWDVVVVGHNNSGKNSVISQIEKSSYGKNFKSFQPLTMDEQLLTPKKMPRLPHTHGMRTIAQPNHMAFTRMPVSRMPISRMPMQQELPRLPIYNVDAAIYVIDTQNDNMPSIAESLSNQIESNVFGPNVPMLFFANKNDLNNKSIRQISTELGLTGNPVFSNWTVQPCNALTGEGIEEGLEWLASAIEQRDDVHVMPSYNMPPPHFQSRTVYQPEPVYMKKKRQPKNDSTDKKKPSNPNSFF